MKIIGTSAGGEKNQKLLMSGMVTKTMASEVHALDKATGILEA